MPRRRRKQKEQSFRGAFNGCQWCHGNGCLQCDRERERQSKDAMKPIFTAQRDDPQDMEAMRRIFGADNIRAAFSPGGGGMEKIRQDAAFESVVQLLRKRESNGSHSETEPEVQSET